MKFEAGKALENKKDWLNLVDQVVELGGHVPQIALQAIREGGVDLYHSSCYNKNPKKVVFRGISYDSLPDLEKATVPNCPSLLKYPDEVNAELDRLFKVKALKILTKTELEDPEIVISPALWHRKVSGNETKCRLIFHDKRNNGYTKPSFNLKQTFRNLPDLENVKYLKKADLKSCYHGWGANCVWGRSFLLIVNH